MIGITGLCERHPLWLTNGRRVYCCSASRSQGEWMRTAEGGGSSLVRQRSASCPGTAGNTTEANPPQRVQGGEATEVWGAIGRKHPFQMLKAVRPDLAGERLAVTGVLRQASLVGPQAIARVPFRRHLVAHPGGATSLSRLRAQCMASRTYSNWCRVRIAAKICVESVR